MGYRSRTEEAREISLLPSEVLELESVPIEWVENRLVPEKEGDGIELNSKREVDVEPVEKSHPVWK